MYKIAINSNINFVETTLPIIVNSLLESGIKEDDIFYFVGGHNHSQKRIIEKYPTLNYFELDHNSIDFNALIAITEFKLAANYWLVLHDTCFVGKNFKLRMDSIELRGNTIPLNLGTNMNIGFYKYEYLLKIALEINKFKNTDYSKEALQY